MGYNVKSVRKKFKAQGIFYTPREIAEYMAKFLPSGIEDVYDPTCGHGSLLEIFADDIEKYGQELNPEAAGEACHIPNSNIVCGDTLRDPAFMGRKFRAIMANPPFSVRWNPEEAVDERFAQAPALPPPSKSDYAFILHILHYLADDGVAVVLSFPGVLYRMQREGKIRQWLVEQNYIDTIVQLKGDAFVDTSISTCLIVLRKNKTHTDVHFIDQVNDMERIVSRTEVEKNGYNLSVSAYLQPVIEKEVIDPWALEQDARAASVQNIERSIAFSAMVAQMEGWSIRPFLDALRAVIEKYEAQEDRRERARASA